MKPIKEARFAVESGPVHYSGAGRRKISAPEPARNDYADVGGTG